MKTKPFVSHIGSSWRRYWQHAPCSRRQQVTLPVAHPQPRPPLQPPPTTK